VTKLLRRSSTASWQTRQAKSTGLQVEVPTDLCRFAEDPGVGVVIKLHTVPPAFGTLDDKKCLIEIDVECMKKDDFQSERATTLGQIDNAQHRKYADWAYQRHDSISRFDEGSYTYYRYDIDCPNGDAVWTRTSVTNVYERGVSLYETEDDAIARRILGSLRALTGFADLTLRSRGCTCSAALPHQSQRPANRLHWRAGLHMTCDSPIWLPR
jgi:hypothetical protein